MTRKVAAAATAILLLAACEADETRPRATATSAGPDRSSRRCAALPEYVKRVRRGYVDRVSPDLNVIPREPNYVGTAAAPVHSGPWNYLARVPLVIHGPGFVRARTFDRPATMADLAPTAARLVGSSRFRAPDGRVLDEALVPGAARPRLVITIVWDGGGWNVLSRHPDAHPFLDELMGRSANFAAMDIGSSPSVTPPIHATLSTGAWPSRHGIPGLRIRRGSEYVDPFIGLDPSNMQLPTLADVYDRETGNRAVTGMLAAVNWHLSMIGQGAGRPGGDRDPAVLFDDAGATFTNEELFSLPEVGDPDLLLREADSLDAADGSRDGEWRSHPLDDPGVRYASPAHVAYQQILLERLIEATAFGRDEVPDLLYVNFKPSDDAGHAWGMTSEETAETLRAQDDALRKLVRYLDANVGRRRWVLMLTADHGQTPFPRESGAWPIGGGELARDANAALDTNGDEEPLVDRVSSPGAYLNRSQLAANDLTIGAVAEWIAAYTVEQNLKKDAELPAAFEGREEELLFDAVVVEDRRAYSEACG